MMCGGGLAGGAHDPAVREGTQGDVRGGGLAGGAHERRMYTAHERRMYIALMLLLTIKIMFCLQASSRLLTNDAWGGHHSSAHECTF